MLKLEKNPTFKTKVGIPVAGQKEPVMVEFEFIGMSRTELKRWGDESRDQPDEDRIPMLIRGWSGVDQPFSEDNLLRLLDEYAGSGRAIVAKFYEEVTGARLGN